MSGLLAMEGWHWKCPVRICWQLAGSAELVCHKQLVGHQVGALKVRVGVCEMLNTGQTFALVDGVSGVGAVGVGWWSGRRSVDIVRRRLVGCSGGGGVRRDLVLVDNSNGVFSFWHGELRGVVGGGTMLGLETESSALTFAFATKRCLGMVTVKFSRIFQMYFVFRKMINITFSAINLNRFDRFGNKSPREFKCKTGSIDLDFREI